MDFDYQQTFCNLCGNTSHTGTCVAVIRYPTRNWICRFHPTDWFHEVGCPHVQWAEDGRIVSASPQAQEPQK